MTKTIPIELNKPSAFTLAAFESVDSTNDELRRRAIKNAEENTVVFALEQSKGRGRRGRTWVSQPGNLFCSILKKPKVPIIEAAKTSFVCALAIHGAIQQAVGDFDCDVTCKWPNDVLIDGYKVSGILLESQAKIGGDRLEWLIIGIGINLAHSPAETPYPSGYINAYREKTLEPQEMLNILLSHFEKWWNLWEKQGFSAIRQAWLLQAKGLGQEITVNLSNEKISGIFENLDHDGALVLRSSHGRRLITAGDVFFT